jgi:hypothetical protein
MEMRTGSLLFPQTRGSGPRTATQTVIFPRDVDRAIAGLTGYSAGYVQSSGDHWLGQLNVQTDVQINRNTVTVTGTFGLRDWSGTWDDDYEGTIQFIVLADLVSALPPATPLRSDLTITDLEITQVIQHFRSAQHLDGPNVRPDNSIRLVARKDTGVRVYVDYDASSGLPPISKLNGTLEVTTSVGSTTITLNPKANITARRDNQILRRAADHTLNFVIPEGWCQGELILRCSVFDASAPAQRSAVFQRTIRFDNVAPLRVYGVGVHYTGQGKDLPAPTQAEALQTLSWVERTYPVGEVLLTGYSTIDFGVDMKHNGSGCGAGFDTLLDRLRDMQGSSDDVYYGVLPAAIDSGKVGGCGGGGGRVGAGFIFDGTTAAQEIGHAFGRDHAPCDDSGRCDDPSGPDPKYPQYNGFPSDSIGEFGYDPANNRVLDPASTFDFMGYSSGNWVSPYTYTQLRSHFPATSGLSERSLLSMSRAAHHADLQASQQEERPEWLRVQTPMLFLRLSINRDRMVVRQPSFHFPAFPVGPSGNPSGFSVELLNKEGTVLTCHQLYDQCKHCPPDCWPKSFRDVIPFPSEAKKLVVWEGKDKIYEENIPNPPSVEVSCKYVEGEGEFEVTYSATSRGTGVTELWYLVQWQDEGDVWRSVAPRTKDRSMRIPPNLIGGFRGKPDVPIRVLATSGIATGMASCILSLPVLQSNTHEIIPMDAPGEGAPTSPILRVAVIDEAGRSVPDPDLAWYDDEGSEIGRGRSLDLQSLGEGRHMVKAVELSRGPEAADRSWLVEWREDGTLAVSDEPRGVPPQQAQE